MNFDAILNHPALAGMRSERRWNAWKLEPSTQRPGKNDKIPLHPITLRPAAVNNPNSWTDCAPAVAAAVGAGPNYGPGYCHTKETGRFFLDIDNALQPDGTWSEFAKQACQWFAGAAVEVSSSGRGLHILGRGTMPPHVCKNAELHAELYNADRFVALTGDGLQGDCDTDHTAALAWFVPMFFAPRAAGSVATTPDTGPRADWRGPADDDTLIRRALQSRSAADVFGDTQPRASFADLWTADAAALARAYPDPNRPYDASSADAALCQHLAYWAGCDAARVERLMRRSALARDKWDRADYMDRTIRGACARQVQVLQDRPASAPQPADAAASPPGQLFTPVRIDDLADYELPPQVWWCEPYLPGGHVTLLSGHGGAGKSTLALMLAVCIAAGLPFLGLPTRRGKVLFFSAEDPGDLVRRRVKRVCREYGIDPAAIAETLHVVDATEPAPVLFADRRSRADAAEARTATYAALREYIEANGIDVLIVDNASDVFDADEINRALVRAFVRSLALLVRSRNGAVLLLAHVDKATSRAGSAAKHESYSGSTAWHNSVRSRLFFVSTGPGLYELQHQKFTLSRQNPTLTVQWPADGLPCLMENFTAPPDPDADLHAVLAALDDAYARKQYPSTARTAGANGIVQVLKAAPTFPRHMKAAAVFDLIADGERQGLLRRENYRKANRKEAERFAITEAGGARIGRAPTAPTAPTPGFL